MKIWNFQGEGYYKGRFDRYTEITKSSKFTYFLFFVFLLLIFRDPDLIPVRYFWNTFQSGLFNNNTINCFYQTETANDCIHRLSLFSVEICVKINYQGKSFMSNGGFIFKLYLYQNIGVRHCVIIWHFTDDTPTSVAWWEVKSMNVLREVNHQIAGNALTSIK